MSLALRLPWPCRRVAAMQWRRGSIQGLGSAQGAERRLRPRGQAVGTAGRTFSTAGPSGPPVTSSSTRSVVSRGRLRSAQSVEYGVDELLGIAAWHGSGDAERIRVDRAREEVGDEFEVGSRSDLSARSGRSSAARAAALRGVESDRSRPGEIGSSGHCREDGAMTFEATRAHLGRRRD